MQNKILLTNIQRFSLHDGPGIRTTVFLKGCSLHCPWCSNPENINSYVQSYVKDGILGKYGEYYSIDTLYRELMKDRRFYTGKIEDYNIDAPDDLEKLPGGITFSGGEPLLQGVQLKPLLKRLKSEHIHMAVETSLFITPKQLEIGLELIDLFYVDVKILDKDKCNNILNGKLDNYLFNLNKLFVFGKPVVIRLPVIGGYTDGKDNRKKIIELLERYRPLKVELIKEHNLGIPKYQSLGLKPPELYMVTDELMDKYKKEYMKTGLWVEVCKI